MPNDYCREPGCTANDQCSSATPVCDLAETGTCVQCTATDAQACTGRTPLCGSDNLCHSCTAHADCASAACLPDGSCGSPQDVAYVVEGASSGGLCSLEAPCGALSRALATGRPFLKLHGAFVEPLLVEGGRQLVLLAAPDSRLTASGGPIITVRDSATSLTIHDLALTDAPGLAGYGLLVPAGAGAPSVNLNRVTVTNNQAGGISVSAGTLAISRSTILGNPGGGLTISGADTAFAITDSFVLYNGRALGAQPSTTGGLAITANTAGSKIERNTIAFNESNGLTFRGGISCNAPLVAAAGNLIYHNAEPDGLGGLKNDLTTQRNTTSNCAFANSLALASDPRHLGFRSPLLPPLDFHLTASTPTTVRDAGGTCTGTDIDGDPRPLGDACDLGADELQP